MARIRGIGELTYSRFHNLPYEADNPVFFQLFIDDNLRSTGQELQCRFPAPWKSKDKQTSLDGDVWDWILDAPPTSLSTECAVLFDGVINFQAAGGGTYRKFRNMQEAAIFVQHHVQDLLNLGADEYVSVIGCLRIFSHLPYRLGNALFALSKRREIMAEALSETWYYQEEEGRKTFLLSIMPDRPVENTDKFLQSFARKLNGALRATYH